MKTILKLVGLVCLSCSALHAGMYLVALRSEATGKYVCAEDGGGGGVNANRNSVGPWERFIVEDLWAGTQNVVSGDPVGIRAESTNKYWCADPSPSWGHYITANRDVRGPWETFTTYGQFGDGTKALFHTCWEYYVVVFSDLGPQLRWSYSEDNPTTRNYTVTILAYTPDPAP